MKVWHWRVYYKDLQHEKITDRALAGIWLSRIADEDTVTDEIHEYLSGELGVDGEDVYKLDIWEDEDKYDLG
jgi:hypothetical protein